jgi:hypothetical protein
VDVDFTEKDQALLDIMERMEECEEENEQDSSVILAHFKAKFGKK